MVIPASSSPERHPRRRPDVSLGSLDPDHLPTPKEWTERCCEAWAGRCLPMEQALGYLAAVHDNPDPVRDVLADLALLPDGRRAQLHRRLALMAYREFDPETTVLSFLLPSEVDASPAWDRACAALHGDRPGGHIYVIEEEAQMATAIAPALRAVRDLYQVAINETAASPQVRTAFRHLDEARAGATLPSFKPIAWAEQVVSPEAADAYAQARKEFHLVCDGMARRARLRLLGLSRHVLAL